MSAELKPCPFCGGDASIHAAYEWPRREGPFYVGCDKCPASLGDQWRETEGGHAPDHVFATEAEATAAWNRRAAELDASGDAEPAGVVNWAGEGGTSVTAALYRPLPHGTKLYTRPPVESAPEFPEGERGVWRPIEWAPRVEGTRALLCWSSGHVEQGFYLDNSDAAVRPWAGWRVESMRPQPAGKLTHWRPMPAPPEFAAPAAGGGESG